MGLIGARVDFAWNRIGSRGWHVKELKRDAMRIGSWDDTGMLPCWMYWLCGDGMSIMAVTGGWLRVQSQQNENLPCIGIGNLMIPSNMRICCSW